VEFKLAVLVYKATKPGTTISVR